jgi:ribosomal-protein-alanine N-acetyltransferase
MAAYSGDPGLSEMMNWEPHRSPADSLAFIEGVALPAYARGVARAWGLCLRAEGDRLVGSMGVDWVSEKDQCMNLGYVLARSCWGRGLATEAGRAVVDHAFGSYPLQRLQAVCMTGNERSESVLRKLGMVHEGILRSSARIKGSFRDMHMYALTRTDWLARAGADRSLGS